MCLDPAKTFRCEGLMLDEGILRLSISLLACAEQRSGDGMLESSSDCLRGFSCCKCRSSSFPLVASCTVHCFLSFSKSSSAFWSSSLSSRTRLSCAANAVRMDFESTGCGGFPSNDGGLVRSSGVFETDEAGVRASDWLLLERTDDRLGEISRLRRIKALESERGERDARGIDE